MPSRDDESRIRILEAYAKAKRANPRLTQGQFMMQGAPGSHLKEAHGKFSSEDSAARYFRKIASGERTGGTMYREAREGARSGQFNIRVKLREKIDGHDQYYSENILAAGGRTSFDIPAVEAEFRKPENFKRFRARVDKVKSKYSLKSTDFDPDSIEVRATRRQRKPIRMRLSLD